MDFRISRTFNLGPVVRFQPQVAVFNLLNANAVLGTVNTSTPMSSIRRRSPMKPSAASAPS